MSKPSGRQIFLSSIKTNCWQYYWRVKLDIIVYEKIITFLIIFFLFWFCHWFWWNEGKYLFTLILATILSKLKWIDISWNENLLILILAFLIYFILFWFYHWFWWNEILKMIMMRWNEIPPHPYIGNNFIKTK